MKFVIDPSVFLALPEVVIAVPIIRGFDNTKSQAESLAFLRDAEIHLRSAYTIEQFWMDKRVTAYLDAFKKFGTDPEVRRPAHVALAKRVLEGGQLPDINPIVNIYNAISITYLTPFGGENLEATRGDFRLFIAKGGEQWFPLGGEKAKPAIGGELVWGDDIDLSTRALNWRQCDRTKMTNQTTIGFFVMDGFAGINREIMEAAASDFVKTAVQLLGGSSEIYWMDRSHPKSQEILIRL